MKNKLVIVLGSLAVIVAIYLGLLKIFTDTLQEVFE